MRALRPLPRLLWMAILRRLAETGEPRAQYEYACMLPWERAGRRAASERWRLLVRAAGTLPTAQLWAAHRLRELSPSDGSPTERRARRWELAAARAGQVGAMRAVAWWSLRGHDPSAAEKRRATPWLRRAVRAGYGYAARDLALTVETLAGDLRRVERLLEQAVLLDEDDSDCLYPLLLVRRAKPWLHRWATLDVDAVRRRAESGDVVSQTYLGYASRFGRRVPLDAVAAQAWFERAAGAGYAEACIALGLMAWDYEAEVHLDDAAAWFARAARTGDATAQWGAAHRDEDSARPDTQRRYRWALAAARQGHVRAAYDAGRYLAHGWGVRANPRAAARWMRVAAEGGLPEAQIWYGEMCADGAGVRGSAREYVVWLRRAAEQGNRDAQQKLGVRLHEGRGCRRNDRECVRWYRRAAAHGDGKAMGNLGLCFKHGHGVRKDGKTALRWFRKAALVGDNPRGALQIADAYRWGWAGRKDPVLRARWLTHGAAMGDAECLGELGIAYHEGEGVPKDHDFAALLYRAAAAKGDPWATYCLGLCSRDGEGVPRSRPRARRWFRRAMALGVGAARRALAGLARAPRARGS